jgi:hypothetical protein
VFHDEVPLSQSQPQQLVATPSSNVVMQSIRPQTHPFRPQIYIQLPKNGPFTEPRQMMLNPRFKKPPSTWIFSFQLSK